MHENDVRALTDSRHTGTVWRKSSHSGNGGGQCVEVAATEGSCLARDSKDPAGPTLSFTVKEWNNFMNRIKSEDRPGQ